MEPAEPPATKPKSQTKRPMQPSSSSSSCQYSTGQDSEDHAEPKAQTNMMPMQPSWPPPSSCRDSAGQDSEDHAEPKAQTKRPRPPTTEDHAEGPDQVAQTKMPMQPSWPPLPKTMPKAKAACNKTKIPKTKHSRRPRRSGHSWPPPPWQCQESTSQDSETEDDV